MDINVNQSVGQLAAEIPSAIRAFEKWGIDYCCQGKTTLENACNSVGAPLEEVVAAISTGTPQPQERNWSETRLAELASYIVDKHHVYTREEVVTLEAIAAKVYSVHGKNHPELERVYELVSQVRNELLPHMLKEEQIIFPYVEELEDSVLDGGRRPTPFFGTVANPIRMMMAEHETAGAILAELRSLTGGYAVPADGCFSYQQLYHRLDEFERDIHQHIHLENNIYFPRALDLEGGNANPLGFPVPNQCCGKAHH